jgi:GNAT superfamily N-acetyltransferase
MRICLARKADDFVRCYPVLAQLRPHLSLEDFTRRLPHLRRQGYRLAYLEDNGQVCAVAGFRILEMWSRGRFLYVDDLVTESTLRRRGYGAALLAWLAHYARKQGCQRLDLDSGVERSTAHQFYTRCGLQVVAFHFAQPIV